MFWRSYSADNIVNSYFGLDKAVNFSTVGDPIVFARQLLLSQLAAALVKAIETFRSQNNFGTLTWQLGEIFPCGGWGSLEYALRGNRIRASAWRQMETSPLLVRVNAIQRRICSLRQIWNVLRSKRQSLSGDTGRSCFARSP